MTGTVPIHDHKGDLMRQEVKRRKKSVVENLRTEGLY